MKFFSIALLLPALLHVPVASGEVDPDKVNAAITKGVTWLKSQQQADGSWPSVNPYKVEGETALALLALLKSDVARDDPAIKKGFDFLAKSKYFDPNTATGGRTYTVCIIIMALEAYGEHKAVDAKTVVDKINIKGNNLEWMKRCHAWLLNNRVEYRTLAEASTSPMVGGWTNPIKGLEGTTKVAWSYPEQVLKTKFDHSNTQYAVLALKSCERCGVKSPKALWYGILNHYLTTQEVNGEEVPRVGLDNDGKTMFDSEIKDRSRGWLYTFDESQPIFKTITGSMTAGSVGSLIMARSVLLNDNQYKKSYATHVDQSVRDGLAWMAKHFSVTSNPEGEAVWHLYFLYAMERIGMLAQITNIGRHLWYDEGAEFLVGKQEGDGSWPAVSGGDKKWLSDDKICDTCFALLFLKRSTMIVTGSSYQHKKEDEKK